MTQVARAQLKKLVDERKVKRDAKPRDVENYSCNVVTERSKKAEIGEKIVAEKLDGILGIYIQKELKVWKKVL